MRLRVRFDKLGKVRFTSHRDLARIWERAVRRADLPVAYSQGFTPRPRLSFGLALSTGYESLAEYLDIELDAPGGLDVDSLPAALSDALPTGLDVTAVAVIEPGTESLQQAVLSCSWDIVLRDIDHQSVDAAITRILAAESIPVTRERKGKPVEDDLRPGVVALALVRADSAGVLVHAELGTQPRALRPSELLAVMDLSDHEGLVRRTHQWMYDGHHRREPLAADVARRDPAAGDPPRRDDDHVRSPGRPDTRGSERSGPCEGSERSGPCEGSERSGPPDHHGASGGLVHSGG